MLKDGDASLTYGITAPTGNTHEKYISHALIKPSLVPQVFLEIMQFAPWRGTFPAEDFELGTNAAAITTASATEGIPTQVLRQRRLPWD